MRIRKPSVVGVLLSALLLVALSLGGCGGRDRQAVTEAVDATMAAFATPAETDLAPYVGTDSSSQLSSYGIDPDEFYANVFKRLSYRIDDVTIEEGVATVEMTLTNVNIEDAMQEALVDFKAWVETEEALAAYAEGGESALYQKLFSLLYDRISSMGTADVTCELHLVEGEDGAWGVASEGNEAFGASLFGGGSIQL